MCYNTQNVNSCQDLTKKQEQDILCFIYDKILCELSFTNCTHYDNSIKCVLYIVDVTLQLFLSNKTPLGFMNKQHYK